MPRTKKPDSTRERLGTASIEVDKELKTEVHALCIKLGYTLREVTERALREIKPHLEKELAKKQTAK